LFAGLIAALILPFSGMQYATAQEEEVDNSLEIALLTEQIQELKKQGDFTTEERAEFKQLKLLKKWFQAEENGNTDRMDRISQRISENFPITALTQAVDVTETVIMDQIKVVSYTGSTEKHYDCSNSSYEFTGYAKGMMYGYSDSLYVVPTLVYPTSINDGYGVNCIDLDFDHAEASYIEVLDWTSNCQIDTFSSPTDTEAKNCTDLKAGSWVLVQAQVWYGEDGDEIFSPWTSSVYKRIW